uniref:ATP synthase subunit a n=1 Tax=Trichodectes canis TaxID=209909 RepID=A0A3G1TIG6_9NEOP|nr:ATP synthase F0 subunit 6 [Trichodectes canis]
MMMCSALSSFDPMINLSILDLIGKHLLLIFVFCFIYSSCFIKPTGIGLFNSSLIVELLPGLKSLFKNYLSVVCILISMFMLILWVNFLGMLPFSFCSSSHMSFNLSLSIPLWLGGIIWMIKTFRYYWVSHFVPLGCPVVLAPFLVIVEVISAIIRPISLSIRLMSNMIAGHMILGLMWESMWGVNMVVLLLILLVTSCFLAFELGVCVIQSYVFSTLMSLYWKESVA